MMDGTDAQRVPTLQIFRSPSLLIAIVLPVVFILGLTTIAAWTATADPGIAPTYDLLLRQGHYNPAVRYEVVDQRLVVTELNDSHDSEPDRYLLFDARTQQTESITLAKAQTLKLDPSVTAADGFKYQYRPPSRDFLFATERWTDRPRLIRDFQQIAIQIPSRSTTDSATHRVYFLGWVKRNAAN